MKKYKLFVIFLAVIGFMTVSCSTGISSEDPKTADVSFFITEDVFEAAYVRAREIVAEDFDGAEESIDAQNFTLEVTLKDIDGNSLGLNANTLNRNLFHQHDSEEKFTTNIGFTDVPLDLDVYAEAVIYYTYSDSSDSTDSTDSTDGAEPHYEYLYYGKTDVQTVVKEGIILKLKLAYPDYYYIFYFKGDDGQYTQKDEFPPLLYTNEAYEEVYNKIIAAGYIVNYDKSQNNRSEFKDGCYYYSLYFDPAAVPGITVTLSDVVYDDGAIISNISIDDDFILTATINEEIDLTKVTVTWYLGDEIVAESTSPESRTLNFNLLSSDINCIRENNDITLLIMYDGVPYTAKTTLTFKDE